VKKNKNVMLYAQFVQYVVVSRIEN